LEFLLTVVLFIRFQVVMAVFLLVVAGSWSSKLSLWPGSRGSMFVALFMGFQLVTIVFLLGIPRFLYVFEPLLSSCLIPSSSSLVALALVKNDG
jgi:hypothetical protein